MISDAKFRLEGRLTLFLVSLAALPAFSQENPQTAPGSSAPSTAALNPEQQEIVKNQIEILREAIIDKALSKNNAAEEVFSNAAQSPKAAVELYLRCYKEVNFDQLDKEDREWREWRDNNETNYEYEPFVRALQRQLEYLALSARVAQEEDVSKVFSPLTNFITRISSMEEVPHPYLDGDVSNSVFAKAYELDAALAQNGENWELNPTNIGGMYEKTILPFLRANMPQNLDNAWAQRIQQQSRVAVFYIEAEEDLDRFEERGRKDDRSPNGAVRSIVNRVRGESRRAHHFQEETLPQLHWGRARDKFLYGNPAQGARDMLDVIQQNMDHDNALSWLDELSNLVSGGGLPMPDDIGGGDDS